MHRLACSALALTLAGCAPSTAAFGPWPAPDPTITDAPVWTAALVEPTRSTAECADLDARVRAHPDSFPSQPPRPREVHPYTGDFPESLRGKPIRTRLVVDEQGAVIPDSTRFAIAIPDRAYEGQLRQAFSEYRFSPAVYQGCAVTAGMIVVLTNVNHP